MRLSELLQEDSFRKANIEPIGTWTTGQNKYVVLGVRGTPVFPVDLQLQHPVLMPPDDPDPVIDKYEAESIRRRFDFGRLGLK
ncbi:MAG TPA: hypothetical protein VFO27_02070, partial [Bryobacteraceae bacterium]|nr:hypothetical protein [Bryobacteraceae bacterium]